MTGPEQHANTVLVGLGWLSMLMHNRCSSDAETSSTNSQLEPFYSALDALVALAERADTLEREYRDYLHAYTDANEQLGQARAEAGRLREALRELEPYAERAEMRWMSVEDATIEIPARLVAELARRAALAGPQTEEQT